MQQFTINSTIFYCSTEQLKENEWIAKISYMEESNGLPKDERGYKAYGPTESEAINGLKEKIRTIFLLEKIDLGWRDILVAAYKWIRSGNNTLSMVIKIAVLLIGCLIFSFVFVDYQKGPFLVVNKNYQMLFKPNQHVLLSADTGFMTEQFISQSLKQADTVFWAANVSFRSLKVGNRANLESFLDRKIPMKLVLLDTGSLLAEENAFRTFSRTGDKKQIVETLESLLTKSGSITAHGDKSYHQVYLSLFSPMLPLVRVDNMIYVSFPIHTDPQLKRNNYGGPFLKFHVSSKMGAMLCDHFNNMINSPDCRIIYPK